MSLNPCSQGTGSQAKPQRKGFQVPGSEDGLRGVSPPPLNQGFSSLHMVWFLYVMVKIPKSKEKDPPIQFSYMLQELVYK